MDATNRYKNLIFGIPQSEINSNLFISYYITLRLRRNDQKWIQKSWLKCTTRRLLKYTLYLIMNPYSCYANDNQLFREINTKGFQGIRGIV